ncbi:YncE family protein [Streptomyces diastatochromogenes]|nr:YncE family protein [Streptomyces diastatochromogenes]
MIDSPTNTVSATIGVGLRPESVSTDPQFGVCVTNGGDNTMSLIDPFNTVVATIGLEGAPGPPVRATRVAVDHILSRAYVTNRLGDRMSIVHISGDPLPFAHDFIDVLNSFGVAVDPMNHRVYVTRPDFDAVSVIDPATNEVIETVPVRQQPTGIAVDAQRQRVYVTNSGSDTVSLIDAVTGDVSDIDVSASPHDVTVDSRGNAYVTHPDGTIQVIDSLSTSVTATLSVGPQPEGLAFEPHSDRLYVANTGNDTVAAIGLATP